MTYAHLLLRLASTMLALLLSHTVLHAQTMVLDGPLVAVQVKGLTTEARDNIMRQLSTTGEARMLFACVPAGILVFESTRTNERSELRERMMPLLRQQSRSQEITELNIGILQAEELCAQARDR